MMMTIHLLHDYDDTHKAVATRCEVNQ